VSHIRWSDWFGQAYDKPQKGGCPAQLTIIRAVNDKRKQMLTITPRTTKTVFRLLIEMVGLVFFQIMYGIKATRKGPAYFSVRRISFPATATIKTTGANRMASINSTTKMLRNIFVRAVMILVHVPM